MGNNLNLTCIMLLQVTAKFYSFCIDWPLLPLPGELFRREKLEDKNKKEWLEEKKEWLKEKKEWFYAVCITYVLHFVINIY